jgi:NADH-quinone oxidoreductase subunit N
MSIAVYALTAFNRRDRRSAEAGLKYFLLGAFATGFLLYGIALVYGGTGSTNIAEISRAVSSGPTSPSMLGIGIALMVVGFAFKVSAVPFHMWTPDVYEGAPAPVTAFMSAGVKAAAFVAFLRIFFVGFDMVQSNVKRMLAYSSIAHAGYLLVAMTAANESAAAGILFYLMVYTVMNIGAFAIVISVAHQGEERLQIEDYSGFGWSQPTLGVLLTIFLLSLAGFPGTGGFIGKIYLLQGAADAELWTLMTILVLTTVASYWYYLRVAWFMWMKEASSVGQHGSVLAPLPMRVALFASVAIILYLGIFPGAALAFAHSSVQGLGVLGGGLLGMAP